MFLELERLINKLCFKSFLKGLMRCTYNRLKWNLIRYFALYKAANKNKC